MIAICAMRGKYYYFYFRTDGETEAQKGQGIFPGIQSWQVAESGPVSTDYSLAYCALCPFEKSQPWVLAVAVSKRRDRETGEDTGKMTRETGKDSWLRLSPGAGVTFFCIRSLGEADQSYLGTGWKTLWKGIPRVFFKTIMFQTSRIIQGWGKNFQNHQGLQLKQHLREGGERRPMGKGLYCPVLRHYKRRPRVGNWE